MDFFRKWVIPGLEQETLRRSLECRVIPRNLPKMTRALLKDSRVNLKRLLLAKDGPLSASIRIATAVN